MDKGKVILRQLVVGDEKVKERGKARKSITKSWKIKKKKKELKIRERMFKING